jgi:hypothetical protein
MMERCTGAEADPAGDSRRGSVIGGVWKDLIGPVRALFVWRNVLEGGGGMSRRSTAWIIGLVILVVLLAKLLRIGIQMLLLLLGLLVLLILIRRMNVR